MLLSPGIIPPTISMADVPALASNFPRDPKKLSSCFSVSYSLGINGGLTDLGGFWYGLDGAFSTIFTSCDKINKSNKVVISTESLCIEQCLHSKLA